MCPVCSRECCDLAATPVRLRRRPLQVCTAKHMSQSSSPLEPPSRHTRLLLYEAHGHHAWRRSRGLPVVEEDCEPQSCGEEAACFRGARSSVLGETRTVQNMSEAEARLRSDLPQEAPCLSSVVRRRRRRRSSSSSLLDREGPSHSHAPPSGALCVAPSGRYLLMSLVLCLLLAGGASGSEFPDRECCDSVPPPPPNYHHATSTTTTTTPPSPRVAHNSSATNGGSQESGGVMNCIEAREQCNNEPMCWSVLKMLHKICGPELVACATVTPSKCKQLLRTLSTFEYLSSCSCAEPRIDFTCYTFRETIFNHPCLRVDTEEPSYTIMPNCKDAFKTCSKMHTCTRDYLEFLQVCAANGMTCTSQESEKCNDVWKKIRQSPVFGCVCDPPSPMRVLAYRKEVVGYSPKGMEALPDYGIGQSCLDIYNATHENPCIVGEDLLKVNQVDKKQATCHVALDNCQKDEECRPYLDDVMVWCEHAHCEPDRCRGALQKFYERVSIVRRLQVAFCVCRQNDPDGECLTAMRKLHPTCAERHAGRGSAKCHVVAEQCRTNQACRAKLEEYEQKCAADAMTGRCSDSHRSCQQAVMNILGTELHATCVCKGTDFLHQHDCYTWQKLLWSNPCVIESHLSLHQEIDAGSTEELDKIFQRPPTVRTTLAPRPPYSVPTSGDGRPPGRPGDNFGTVIYSPDQMVHPSQNNNWDPLPPRVHEDDRYRVYDTTGQNSKSPNVWGKNGMRIGSNGIHLGGGRRTGIRLGHNHNGNTNVLIGGGRGSFNNRDRNPTGVDPYDQDYIPGYGIGSAHGNHRGTPIPREDTDFRSGRLPAKPSWFENRPPTYPDPATDHYTLRPHFQSERHRPPPYEPVNPRIPIPTPTPPALPPPTGIASTTTPPTTTLAQRSCTIKNVEDERMKTLRIPEGSSRRLYKDKDCSELCHCRRADNRNGEPEASCITLSCIDNKSCNTTRAVYPHSAPYYLAFRGDCVCYAGKFICQKPNPEQYSLPPGIYLFLGYSQGEMEILKPHTESTELEALEQVKEVLVRDYGFKCNLTTKHHIGENFIVVAQLIVSPDTYMTPFTKQRKEKEECAGPLQKLADKINARPRHVDILTDAYLSMFILADVDVSLPEAQTAASAGQFLSVSFSTTILLPLLTMLLAHVLTVASASSRPSHAT